MKFVRRLASLDIMERRNSLMDTLREQGVPFIHRRDLYGGNWVENIIASINPSNQRLVIGAHYDNFEGSTGANDNASGVAVLLRLAKWIYEYSSISVDIVFFDREEYPGRGSEKYIQEVGEGNIAAMVNLDGCGFGDCIAVYRTTETNKLLDAFTDSEKLRAHHARVVKHSENGDFSAFSSAGIDALSLTVYRTSEVDLIDELTQKYIPLGISRIQDMGIDDQIRIHSTFESSSTMHNRPNDNISSVSQEPMDMVYDYLRECVQDLTRAD